MTPKQAQMIADWTDAHTRAWPRGPRITMVYDRGRFRAAGVAFTGPRLLNATATLQGYAANRGAK